MVLGMFSWHTLNPLVPIVNATSYLSIVSDHVHVPIRIMHHVTKLESFQIMTEVQKK